MSLTIRHIKRLVKLPYFFILFLLEIRIRKKNTHRKKIIHLSLDPSQINRYFLTFLNLLPDNFLIDLQCNVRTVIRLGQHLHINSYEKRIASHPKLQLSFRKKKNTLVSSDFFNAPSKAKIPIGVHPNFPKLLINAKNEPTHIITFVGARDRYYEKFDSSLWSMPNRLDHWNFIVREIGFITIRDRFSSQEEYINHLSESSFFLCLPGYIMPPCHNLYESMSLGCIPIIHESYHAHLPWPVQSATRHFLYSDLRQLKHLATSIYNGELRQLEFTARNDILALVSSGFGVEQLLSNNSTIFICAEEESVKSFSKS